MPVNNPVKSSGWGATRLPQCPSAGDATGYHNWRQCHKIHQDLSQWSRYTGNFCKRRQNLYEWPPRLLRNCINPTWSVSTDQQQCIYTIYSASAAQNFTSEENRHFSLLTWNTERKAACHAICMLKDIIALVNQRHFETHHTQPKKQHKQVLYTT